MTRFKLFLLALMLLLSFCACTQDEGGGESVTNAPAFYVDGELPDIGDFSGNKELWYGDKDVSSFVPSDEYKLLIPFVSRSNTYTAGTWEDGYAASSVYLSYGFCTPDGKVVWDSEGLISNIYHDTSDDGFGYYQIYMNDEDENNLEGGEMYAPQRTLLIPQSGEWCLELEKGSWIHGVNYGYIMVQHPLELDEYGFPVKTSIRIYGYDGELKKEFNEQNMEVAAENLFLVHDYNDYSSVSKFVNIDGETVYGPFKNAQPFNEYGVTYVTDNNGDSYFMKKDGSRINGKIYESIQPVYGRDGCVAYVAYSADNISTTDVYRGDGTLLSTVNGSPQYFNLYISDDGKIIRSKYDYGNYNYIHDDGSPFVNEDGLSPNEFSSVDGVFVNKNEETLVSTLFDYNGKNIAEIYDLSYINDISCDRKYLVYQQGSYDFQYDVVEEKQIVINNAEIIVYDAQNSEILVSLPHEGSGWFFGENDRYIMITTYDSGNYFYGGNGKSHVYDTVKKELIFEDCLNVSHYILNGNMYFCVSNSNKSTLYDENLNPLVINYYE